MGFCFILNNQCAFSLLDTFTTSLECPSLFSRFYYYQGFRKTTNDLISCHRSWCSPYVVRIELRDDQRPAKEIFYYSKVSLYSEILDSFG